MTLSSLVNDVVPSMLSRQMELSFSELDLDYPRRINGVLYSIVEHHQPCHMPRQMPPHRSRILAGETSQLGNEVV